MQILTSMNVQGLFIFALCLDEKLPNKPKDDTPKEKNILCQLLLQKLPLPLVTHKSTQKDQCTLQKLIKNLVGVQSTKNFGEWRGAAKFYMLMKRSKQRSNTNQTSIFQTSSALLSLTQVNLNVFRHAFT